MSEQDRATARRDLGIDRDLCMGSGQCCVYAPNTFALDEFTIATVIDPHGDPDAAISMAVSTCPTGAISTRG